MFGSGNKIKLDKDLYIRAKKIADQAGYATVDEFVADVLDKELQNFQGLDNDDAIQEKLRGLGYIS